MVASAEQVLTPCQKKQVDFFTSPPAAGKYFPRCSPEGLYVEVQCTVQNDECWCVHENGTEIPQSRTKGPIRCPKPGHYSYLLLKWSSNWLKQDKMKSSIIPSVSSSVITDHLLTANIDISLYRIGAFLHIFSAVLELKNYPTPSSYKSQNFFLFRCGCQRGNYTINDVAVKRQLNMATRLSKRFDWAY